jgi:hypothetical protein
MTRNINVAKGRWNSWNTYVPVNHLFHSGGNFDVDPDIRQAWRKG